LPSAGHRINRDDIENILWAQNGNWARRMDELDDLPEKNFPMILLASRRKIE
jgi:hypothetical protein